MFTKTCLVTTLFVLATSGAAHAGGESGSIGVGAEVQLSGLGGGSVNYDAGKFHVGGFFGFRDPQGGGNTFYDVGGRFYYHVHSTAMSDFGLGGEIGIASCPDTMNPPGFCQRSNPGRATDVFLQPAAEVRLFLASNVALSFDVGIVIGVIDASSVTIGGNGDNGGVTNNITGGAGFHYYFF